MGSIVLVILFMAKNLPANARNRRKCGFDPWVGKIPWSRKWQPIPRFLPGNSHEQRSLKGYSPWVSKSKRLLSDCTHTQHRFK